MKETIEKIEETIEKIRPYLNNDGGDVKFIKFEDGICYVSLEGACSGCPFAELTLRNTVEEILISEIPEIIKVENIKEV